MSSSFHGTMQHTSRCAIITCCTQVHTLLAFKTALYHPTRQTFPHNPSQHTNTTIPLPHGASATGRRLRRPSPCTALPTSPLARGAPGLSRTTTASSWAPRAPNLHFEHLKTPHPSPAGPNPTLHTRRVVLLPWDTRASQQNTCQGPPCHSKQWTCQAAWRSALCRVAVGALCRVAGGALRRVAWGALCRVAGM